jgi:hypothetical protein
MPGGGTPALAPISTPATVCPFPPPSYAIAGDHESANTPAAAKRVLLYKFRFMCLPFSFGLKAFLTGWLTG